MWRSPVDLWASLAVRNPKVKDTPFVSSKAVDPSSGSENTSDDEPLRGKHISPKKHGSPALVTSETQSTQLSVAYSPHKGSDMDEDAVQHPEFRDPDMDDLDDEISADQFKAQLSENDLKYQFDNNAGRGPKRKTHARFSPLPGTHSSTISIQPAPKEDLTPIPISTRGGVSNSEAIIRLNHLLQKNGLRLPDFEFGEDDAQLFSGRLLLTLPAPLIPFAQRAAASTDHGTDVEAANVENGDSAVLIVERQGFPNKKSGRQSLSQIALNIMELAIEEKKSKEGCKALNVQKSSDGSHSGSPDRADKAQEENYIGLLHEFLAATSNPLPSYAEYLLGTRFSCILTINVKLPTTVPVVLPIRPEGLHQQGELKFGSETIGQPTKKAARKAAAKEAVEFLRRHKLMHAAGAPPMRKKEHIKSTSPHSHGSTSSQTRTSQISSSNSNPLGPTLRPLPTPTKSFHHRVSVLCAKMNLGAVEYGFTELPGKPSFFDCIAHISGATEDHLKGPVGHVECVYGRKAAKEGTAEIVLGVLEKEYERLNGAPGS